MVGAMSTLAFHRLSMWEQDRSAGFADRIASRCSLPDPLFHCREDIVSHRMEEDASSWCYSDDESESDLAAERGRRGRRRRRRRATTVLDSEPEPTVAVPSLSSDSASSSGSVPSSLSLDTIWATGIVGNDILEDDGTGALVVPSNHSSLPHHHHHPHHHHRHHLHSPPPPAPTPPPNPDDDDNIYACLFHILDCQDTFNDAELWKTHVLSHFRTHEPPDTARCPLCSSERFHSTLHHRAWDLLLEHVDVAHYQHGETLAGSRPDFELMQYLYRLRVISVDQFKVMQLAPPPSSPAYHRSQEPVRANVGSSDEPYCAPYNRRREERMRGQRRGVGVA